MPDRVECNGPRDCIGTERGCSHCDPPQLADITDRMHYQVADKENFVLTPDETELIADSLEESQRDVNRLVVRVNGLLVKIEAIKLLLREAGESHTDYVFVPDLDAILGTRYGR